MYRERAFSSHPHRNLYRIVLVIGVIGFIVGALPFGGDYGLKWIVLPFVFAIFSIVSTILDYYTKRTVRREVPRIQQVTAQDVLRWQSVIAKHEGRG